MLEQFLSPERLNEIDLFDRMQLYEVIKICKSTKSLAEAGRILFNVSRDKKSSINDSHRVKQFLQKYNLTFQIINSV